MEHDAEPASRSCFIDSHREAQRRPTVPVARRNGIQIILEAIRESRLPQIRSGRAQSCHFHLNAI